MFPGETRLAVGAQGAEMAFGVGKHGLIVVRICDSILGISDMLMHDERKAFYLSKRMETFGR